MVSRATKPPSANACFTELRDHLQAALELLIWLLWFGGMYCVRKIQRGCREVKQVIVEAVECTK
jgi:hypothetical protein